MTISKSKGSKFDQPDKMVKALQKLLGTKIPKKRVSRKEKLHTNAKCSKCGKASHLQIHTVTYIPRITTVLCTKCRKRVIALSARGTQVAFGDLTKKPKYTNKIRAILFRWFLDNPWPVRKNGKPFRKPNKTTVLDILRASGFRIQRKRRVNYSVPWRHDFKNNCVKCNRAYHLQIHHITYNPERTAFLCEGCHSKITSLNTRAAEIAKTSKKYKPAYTNNVRLVLWNWFLNNPWPTKNKKPTRRLSKTSIREILGMNGFSHLETNIDDPEKESSETQSCTSTLTLNSVKEPPGCVSGLSKIAQR